MHYYTFHPKDYMSKTNFLEPMEDLAYRRMLDYQYLHESPLPADIDEIAMLINMRTHSDSIAVVLRYFFELTDDGYINDRAEKEIAKYQEKSEKARKSANARWKKKTPKASKDKGSSDVDANALQTDSEGNANQEPLTKNHKPLTKNQEPVIAFDDFWNAYGKKIDTAKCKAKWSKLKPLEQQAAMEHVPRYVASTPDKKFRKNPLTYLNGQCWLDEIEQPQTTYQGNNHANNQSANSKPNHFDQLRAEAAAKYGNASTIRTVN